MPTIISYLLEGEAPARELLSRIRFCRSASAALPPEHHRAFEAKFGIGIVETMGLTETVAPAFSNPIEPQLRKIGSVGRASGCEARVVDAAGAPLADGNVGEIVIRGPQVTPGYYKNDGSDCGRILSRTAGCVRGDLGYRDDDGFFFVTGRIKELIIKGGENIAPREIDEALLRASGGARRRGGGHSRPALRPGDHGVRGRCATASAAREEELRDFCSRELGRYKTPKMIRFVDDLPRGPSGKVQRLRLADLASSTV